MAAPMARVTAHKFCVFSRNILGKQNPVFNTALPKQYPYRYASNFTRNQTNRIGKWLKTGALCGGSVLVAFLASKSLQNLNLGLQFPEVNASVATDADSPRKRFNFIADIVEKAAPAVVHIEIQGRHPFTGQMMPVSNGSGFIVREDGLIMSNAHVVANKMHVVVQLKDGRRFDGVVQAVDSVSDLATIKINAKNLPTLKLGNSKDLRPGEWVIAMGSPLTLNDTVTSGIVSTTHRGLNVRGQRSDIKYIQTDAVITHGNSGGPLVNLDGEAIGINTMKLTAGISFAIPSDYAQVFLGRAFEVEQRPKQQGWFGSKGGTRRYYIGINMLTLTPTVIQELVRHMDLPPDVSNGVLVHDIYSGSPAHAAGVQPGDIITSINGQDVTSANDVYNAVSSNTELRVTLRRGRNTLLVTMRPEEVS